ncbi:MAG: orotate phosphoribosyltransferase [Candidatus Yanofskybacteria bacterium CG10_big_fil_rev_8_21_14_0_10_37_15]|uniref:Orotate phosphoribosyltransferase n=1 Tax=Candidatus Yanofskybacteria bacterium CG10_big_fil_rev_8_21_14_0_10_37_15 TaxID=1975097 RepID=A0A2H0R681_9BACT|nr:MAG: orotate phosphoribosyltransferase [Candidatus Yanofskybacteria bacterium CG10_big_fil_rev_8_21_14_0_10_37_15]
MSKKNLLKRLTELGIIYKEKVKLRSGSVSNFYCDIKKAYGYPDILNAIADEVGQKLPKKVNCIAASGYGGLPLASVISTRFNKRLTLVRDKVKNHGKKKFIDGHIPDHKDKIAIIDDVITTGSSIINTVNGLKNTGAQIVNAIIVVKRSDDTLSIPHSYIFTIEEILKDK